MFCLTEGEFLNDVIIDFYLKYLYHDILSERDRERTFIFSSFFYKRLTQKPRKGLLEDNNAISLQVRRCSSSLCVVFEQLNSILHVGLFVHPLIGLFGFCGWLLCCCCYSKARFACFSVAPAHPYVLLGGHVRLNLTLLVKHGAERV